jgi:acyl-CoA thioester hydrolase
MVADDAFPNRGIAPRLLYLTIGPLFFKRRRMKSSDRTTPFEMVIRVEPADIDVLGHVNNIVYLRWVQDIAVAHWRAVASAEHRAELHWMVIRHEIDYKRAAVLDDEILVRTWIGAAEGLRFERLTEMYRDNERDLLARARTLWCPIDAKTGRPRRVPPEVRSQFSADPPDQTP